MRGSAAAGRRATCGALRGAAAATPGRAGWATARHARARARPLGLAMVLLGCSSLPLVSLAPYLPSTRARR